MPHVRRWGHTATAVRTGTAVDASASTVVVFGGFGRDPVAPPAVADSGAGPAAAAAAAPPPGDARMNTVLHVSHAGMATAASAAVRGAAVVGPSKREQHSAVAWVQPPAAGAQVPERVLVYGGRTNPSHALDDVWITGAADAQPWRQLVTRWSDDTPRPIPAEVGSAERGPALCRHTAAWQTHTQRMIVFGGRFGLQNMPQPQSQPQKEKEKPLAAAAVAAAPAPVTPAVADVKTPSPAAPPVVTAASRKAAAAPSPAQAQGARGPRATAITRRLSADVYAMHIGADESGVWTRVATTGVAPTPRCAHAAALTACGTRLYVFGGLTDAHSTSPTDAQLYVLDFGATNAAAAAAAVVPKWSVVSDVTGTLPNACYSHTLNAIGSGDDEHLLLVGGATSANALQHTHVLLLHIATKRWYKPHIRLVPPPASALLAAPVVAAAGAGSGEQKSDTVVTAAAGFVPSGLFVKHRTCVLPAPTAAAASADAKQATQQGSAPAAVARVLMVGGGINCFSFGSSFSPTLVFDIFPNAVAGAARELTFVQIPKAVAGGGEAAAPAPAAAGATAASASADAAAPAAAEAAKKFPRAAMRKEKKLKAAAEAAAAAGVPAAAAAAAASSIRPPKPAGQAAAANDKKAAADKRAAAAAGPAAGVDLDAFAGFPA